MRIRYLLIATVLGFGPAGAAAGDRWPDPVANHVRPAPTVGLTHGPIIGRPAAHGVRVWVRTEKPCAFRVHYARRLPLDAETPAVDGETAADDDNTGTVDLAGLAADTRYYYGIRIDGRLADIRTGFAAPWPSFRTLPDAETCRGKHNPDGLFNICFSIGCGGCQDAKRSGGQYHDAAAFAALYRKHRDEIRFHVMNGDYTYEEKRDGTLDGVRANYRLYLERGRSMRALQRNVPWLFMYDDHEVHDNLFGAGEVGFRGGRRVYARDVQLKGWYEYAGWANYRPDHRGVLRFGRARVQKGSDVLEDRDADFSGLDPAQVSTILAGTDGGPGRGVYGLVAVLDKHRLRVRPAFRVGGEIRYSIGTHHYYDFVVANAHFFVVDTRGERSSFSPKKIRSPAQFLLGKTQLDWLLSGAKNTKADFIFIVSSTGCVIPHSAYHVNPSKGTRSKGDGFPGFVHERERMLAALDELAVPVIFITGDVHNSASVRVTDNVWEFMAGPLNSNAHPIGTLGNMPRGGPFTHEGRRVLVRWVAGFPNDVHYSRLHSTYYCIVRVNNVLKTARPDGVGLQWVAYDVPQVVAAWYDGYTGRLVYAESVTAHPAAVNEK